MAISLTLLIRTIILISLIALTCSKQWTSHPRRLIHTKPIKTLESPNKKPHYLHLKSTIDDSWTSDNVAHIVLTASSNPPAFLANISFGNPPRPQLLLIDTGSDLTWLQCLPCKSCYPQTVPLFNPLRSSTYRNASCESAPHAMPRLFRDNKTETCRYFLGYRDCTNTRGVLAKEKITFQTSDDGLISKPNIVFGCGHENSGFDGYSGMLGLGPGRFSIVIRSFGSKFSYCFGSLTDPSPHNFLILGNGAITEGNPTPLKIYKDRYYLDLQAISFGDKRLDIEPDVFRRHGAEGGTIIDTGCSHTILAREAYDALSEEIDFHLGKVVRRVRNWEQYRNPCYEGNFKLLLYGFPVVKFHFAGDAELALDIGSLFKSSGSGDSFCLAMIMSPFDDMNVIGAMTQQNYNVGYDLRTMNVYFHRIACDQLL